MEADPTVEIRAAMEADPMVEVRTAMVEVRAVDMEVARAAVSPGEAPGEVEEVSTIVVDEAEGERPATTTETN